MTAVGPAGRSAAASSGCSSRVGAAGLPALLAALAACGIGTGAAVQQREAHGIRGPGAGGVRLIVRLARRPLWLLGVVAMVAGYGLQAAALDLGRLALVEPVLATSLIVALLLAALRVRAWPRAGDWLSMLLAAGGVALFLVVASPAGGHSVPTAASWAPLLGGVALLAAGVLWRAPRWPARHGAMGLAGAAGICLGTSDALVKTTLALAGSAHGSVLASFPLPMLVVAGAAGFLLQQHAYRVGELRAALPAASVLEPVTGTLLGLTLFGERLAARDAGSGLLLGLAAAAAVTGVWRLGGTALVAGSPAPGRVSPGPEAGSP